MIDWSLAIPYALSNLLGVALIALAWQRPRLARGLVAIGFAIAAAWNARAAFVDPLVYLSFARDALPPYPWLIEHVFGAAPRAFLLAIAGVQLAGAVALGLGGRTTARLGALALIAFLIAIAPFGLGSAFPMPLLCAVAIARIRSRL